MRTVALIVSVSLLWPAAAQNLEPKPDDPFFAPFQPKVAPRTVARRIPAGTSSAPEIIPGRPPTGIRLAICGDSITEQKMYSRIMETYLAVCTPELDVAVRQYGWSGEQAPGFLARMTDDVLRFKPNVATTCYGMNDHGYRTYEPAIGERYRDYSTTIVKLFKQTGTFVVLGSPGCVGKVPTWTKSESYTVEQLNLNLCELRNIGIEIAAAEKTGFADVFWPMLQATFEGRKKYGPDYAIPGKDGVHPGWAGQLLMAHAFLKGLGVDGEIGTFTIDMKTRQATVSAGHERLGFKDGNLQILSKRYPFCAAGGDVTKDDNIRSGMTLVPFNQELNRLLLVITNGAAKSYKVAWGAETRSYPAEQLAKGVNLAEDFAANPFSTAFNRVDEAVAAKQSFETWQIKEMFNGPLGRSDLATVVERTEKAREPLAQAIKAAFVPVKHTVRVTAE